ncbi:MAG: 4Fe-4S dicluster domain-containing protein [Fibrobacteria bacterium]|nr:4Fe-4S dicluster domain-containing protein [Fibrobacteria bacterium]
MTDKHTPKTTTKACSRRSFLKTAGKALPAVPLLSMQTEAGFLERFFQKNFKELSTREKDQIVKRLEQEYEKEYGKKFTVGAEPALKGVQFAYALDLSRCIGCRKCVYGCVTENNLSIDPQIHWIRVLEMDEEEGVNLHNATPYYNHKKVPAEGKAYMPVQCQHCRNAPCTKVCPVQATWLDDDGIVVIDYDWCIGCRYCIAACPYGARHFNWAKPKPKREGINTNTHYLGNRPRMKGVVEKCTFCVQRTRKGKYPACVEACPVGARKFGNLLDPESEVSYILKHKRVFILKEELNTQPKFYYFYG